MAKKAKNVRRTAKQLDLIASAASIGFNIATSYGAAVVLFRTIGTKSKVVLADAGLEFKVGYVARYLSDAPAMQKRWGNLNEQQKLDEAREIYAKPYPESSKPNRRNDLEHKACRAADVSLATCKRRAGLIAEKKGGRKPRPAANKSDKAVPVDLVKASPTLKTKAACNDYFATAAAALLATVNKNAKHVTPRISSAVSELHAAMVAEGLIVPAK